MAAKTLAALATNDEVLFHNDSASLCLLLNRRTRTMRVFDFRAGPAPSKRTFVLSVARREQIERVFALVEREEVSTWQRLGLVREGVVPGFFRRSDGFVMGTVLEHGRDGPRPRLASARGGAGSRSDGRLERPSLARLASAERTLRAAKRLLAEPRPRGRPAAQVRVVEAREHEARDALTLAQRKGVAATCLEPFGRNGVHRYFRVQVKGSPAVWVALEVQECFANAFVELLALPGESDGAVCGAALGALCGSLSRDEVAACYALTPAEHVPAARAFLGAGFRRTGVLARHIALGAERSDAILWSRKAAS